MVYMEQIHVGSSGLLFTWNATKLRKIAGNKAGKFIFSLLNQHLAPAIDFVRTKCSEKVPSSVNQLTSSLLNLLEAELLSWVGVDKDKEADKTASVSTTSTT